jgi:hypothetical protein
MAYKVHVYVIDFHALLCYKIMQGNINCLTEIVQVLTQMLHYWKTI